MPDNHWRQCCTISGEALARWYAWAQQQAVVQSANWEQPPALQTELTWLLQTVAQLDTLTLRLETYRERPAIPLSIALSELTRLWIQRLETRQPIQYVLGHTVWRGFVLQVSPAVLIPRPETELMVDLAVAAMAAQGLAPEAVTGHWVDVGTGSGAIAIALATVFPQAILHAIDTSADALSIAHHNTQQQGLQKRIQFYLGHCLEPIDYLHGQCQGIVSNPPYIPSAMIPNLQPEVARHEPHLALDGGSDGLDMIRIISTTASDHLQAQGILLLEMMHGQSATIQSLLESQTEYHSVKMHQDWAGITRFAETTRW